MDTRPIEMKRLKYFQSPDTPRCTWWLSSFQFRKQSCHFFPRTPVLWCAPPKAPRFLHPQTPSGKKREIGRAHV